MKVAWELLKTSMAELTEGSLSEETEQEIIELICSVPNVQEPHNLRTRRIGNHIAIEAHIRMDGSLSLNEAHEQATAVERKLKERFGDKIYVSIHMEPMK